MKIHKVKLFYKKFSKPNHRRGVHLEDTLYKIGSNLLLFESVVHAGQAIKNSNNPEEKLVYIPDDKYQAIIKSLHYHELHREKDVIIIYGDSNRKGGRREAIVLRSDKYHEKDEADWNEHLEKSKREIENLKNEFTEENQ